MKIQKIILLAFLALLSSELTHASCGKFSCSAPTINEFSVLNSDVIELPAATDTNQSGTPCPSTVQVSNVPVCHVITRVTVQLGAIEIPPANKLTYENANLLTVVLVSPWGACSVLMNSIAEQVGGLVDNFDGSILFFDSCFANNLPRRATGITIDGSFRPTDYRPGDYCFDETGCIPKTLLCKASTNIFKGKSPCGTWKLFTCIKPGSTTNPGSIAGWIINFETCLPCNNKWCSRPGIHGDCCVQCNPGGPCLPCKPCHPCIDPCDCCFKQSNCFACSTGCCLSGSPTTGEL